MPAMSAERGLPRALWQATVAGHCGGTGHSRSSVLWQLGSGHWGIPLFFGLYFLGVGLFLASCLDVWIWLECGGVDAGGWRLRDHQE